ncbi:MAG: DUF1501 domain-containing protein [Planctomycetota bacterium]|nr:DUF1501 domain-containing protein [Planctomycetota bacterium]
MLNLGSRTLKTCAGVSRRELLQLGGCSALGLSLPHLLGDSVRAATAHGKVKSVLLLWLWGGPSHHETWDPKPDAPSKIRGCYSPIATASPGVQISELLPMAAAHSRQFTIIRSMAHDMKDHNQGGTVALTGSTNGSQASGGVPFPGRVRPSMGSLISYLTRERASEWPSFTCIGPNCKVSGADLRGQLASALGAAHDPFRLDSFTFEEGFKIPPSIEPLSDVADQRFSSRRSLLTELDEWQRTVETAGEVERYNDVRQKAFGLLTSTATKAALDLESESEAMRDRYGRTVFGQNCILGRRLIESGVPFVQINWSGDAEDEQQGGDGGWDLHYRLFERMQDRYCPIFDLGFTALLDDLEQRGLLESTLVLAMGEFGRSPEISSIGGREHWPYGYSMVVAGGGTPGGSVIGSTTADGGFPADRPVHPSDLILTVIEKMGLDRFDLFARDSAVLGSSIEELS